MATRNALFHEFCPMKLLHRNPKRGHTQPGGCQVTSYVCLFHLIMYLTNDDEFQRKPFTFK